jgi:hypothetical protein
MEFQSLGLLASHLRVKRKLQVFLVHHNYSERKEEFEKGVEELAPCRPTLVAMFSTLSAARRRASRDVKSINDLSISSETLYVLQRTRKEYNLTPFVLIY